MKTFKLLASILFVAFFAVSCQYIFILPEVKEVPWVDPDEPDSDCGGEGISFSEKVLPIFTNNCVSCHKTGGTSPDLSADKAFSALNSSKYINRTSPEESKIYLHPHPDTDTHKHKKYSASQAAIVLSWIESGAKDS